MVNVLETLLAGMFGAVFGTPLMAGLVGLLLLIVMCAILRLSFEGYLVVIMPATFLMLRAGLLPEFVYYPLLILSGFIIYLAFMRVTNR